MKIEHWWKCRRCTYAYSHFADAAKCHHAGIERIALLIGDNGKPISAPIRQMRRNDEDETFGLMSDLLGEL